jgi:hypothetical protein
MTQLKGERGPSGPSDRQTDDASHAARLMNTAALATKSILKRKLKFTMRLCRNVVQR